MVAFGSMADEGLRILVDNFCCNIQPNIVRGADWAFCPRGRGFKQGETLNCVFMCANPHLAGCAVFKVPPGILQVIAIGGIDWPIARDRPEKLVYLFAI